jgi:hypothetical protein
MLPRIDPVQSSVHLRNPHGRNDPNARGANREADEDGNFDLSFDQYFRAFDWQASAVVTR